VAKSKQSPALFELLDQQSTNKKLAVPSWFKDTKETDAHDTPTEAASDAVQPPQAPALQQRGPKPTLEVSRPRTPAPDDPTDEHPPIVRLESGRVEISLNLVNAAVVVCVALLTLFSSYLIGQSVGTKQSPDVQTAGIGLTDDLLNQPLDSRVLDVANRPNTLMQERTPEQPKPSAESGQAKIARATATDSSSSTVGPQAIMNYIVVESFKIEHQKSAEYVQKWLAEQNLETELKKSGNRWLLVTTGGFDITQDSHKAARDQLIENLKLNGPACAEALRNQGLPEYGLKGPYATR